MAKAIEAKAGLAKAALAGPAKAASPAPAPLTGAGHLPLAGAPVCSSEWFGCSRCRHAKTGCDLCSPYKMAKKADGTLGDFSVAITFPKVRQTNMLQM